jgi:hypothetical protein
MTRGMLGDKYMKRNDVKRRGTGKPPHPLLEEGNPPLEGVEKNSSIPRLRNSDFILDNDFIVNIKI